MRSRFCVNFTSGIPVSFNNDISYTDSLNFSAEFWQPFIDLTGDNESMVVCGPFLGIAIEVSKFLKSELTYVRTPSGEFYEDFDMMGNRITNMLLTPFPPMSINLTNVSQHMQLSRPIGDVAMISILSSKEPIHSLFHLINIFNYEIWLCTIVSYIIFSCLSALISDESDFFFDYLAVALRQTMEKLYRTQRTATISIIWFYGTMILMWAFSGMLLTFLVLPTPYSKIDSMYELAQRDIKFTVFEGENAYEYINDPREPYYQMFFNRCVVEDPENDVKEEWEKIIFDKISKGTHALVSDQLFLDYYYATKLLNYSNLHRSESNQLVLPYFMPLARHNSQQLAHTINIIICRLVESGIYENWLKDTLDSNNDAVRLGFVEKVDKKYEYLPLLLNHFKSIFYVQIVALMLSIVVYILEVIHLRLRLAYKLRLAKKRTYYGRRVHKTVGIASVLNTHKIERYNTIFIKQSIHS